MAVNATLTPETINEGLPNEEVVLSDTYSVGAAGDETLKFSTAGKYVNKNIHLTVSTPAAGAVTLDADDNANAIVMGTPNEGIYSPTATITGTVNVASAGWITAGDKSVSEANVALGTVAQSTLAVDGSSVASGSNIVPDVDDDQTVTISAGYHHQARTLTVKSMADGQEAEVTSPDATISSVTYTANDTDHTFNISGTETIAAPTVDTAGIISATKGTKNAGTAEVDVDVAQVTVGVTPSSTDIEVTPVIARTAKPAADTWTDPAAGGVVTSKPSSGVYVQVDVAAVPATTTVTGKVSAAGYGNTEHYQADAATTIKGGSKAATTAYVPITTGVVESGTATISTVTHTYDSESGKFDIAGSANVSAPTATTSGYVGVGGGTLSAKTNGATVDAQVDKIGIRADITADTTFTPVISKNAATNVNASAATTSQPATGHYVAVNTAQLTGGISAVASVTSAGYGTATSGQYTAAAADTETITVNGSATTYIPIPDGTLSNAASAGVSYVDLSTTAPIIPSEGALYIGEGYYAASKIDLARLVPDEATIVAATGAAYILQGQSAYDKDSKLVTGTIPTYDGSYTIG